MADQRKDSDPRDVPIRPAATVMMVRDAESESGVEVFMLRRNARATFGAGMYVFPGGRVDDVDSAAGIEPFCRGLTNADASNQLGIVDGGLSYWVAAIRECFEEAGILLASRRDGSALDLDDDDRHGVHDGTLPMIELCKRDDLVLDLSTTQYVDHWITPIGENRRFDTRFFVTEAPEGQEGLHDDKETVESLWVRPADALRMVDARELAMMPPTIANVKWLADFASADAAIDAGAAKRDIPTTLPKLKIDADGRLVGIARPGDPDFDAIETDDPQFEALAATRP